MDYNYDDNRENLNQPSKYDMALGKYNTDLNDGEIAGKTAHLVEKCLQENDTQEVRKFLFNCIDLTTLKCTDSEDSVMRFTERVNDFVDKYPDLKNVAAICVYPNMAEIVNDTLEADDVKIACVSGGFPSSQTFTEVKVAETAMAIHAGADEIDIVIPVGKFLSGDYEGMCDEIEELKEVCGDKHLKVILETGALGTAQNIKRAAILAMYSGADFIKTSTLCDVSGHQGIFSGDGAQGRFQACRRHQYRARRVGLLYHCKGSLGQGMAEQRPVSPGHESSGQSAAFGNRGRRDQIFLRTGYKRHILLSKGGVHPSESIR